MLIACKEPAKPTPPPPAPKAQAPLPDAPVRTDRTRYVLAEGPFGPETTIVTTFRAPADRRVYLVNCNGAFALGLQRLDGDRWVDAWGAEMNACLSAPIVIPAGRQHSGTMTVASGADAVVSGRRTERRIVSGTYRAVWYGVLTSFDFKRRPFGDELPLEQRSSAPFVIEAAAPPDPSRTSPAVRPAEILSIEPAHTARVAAFAPLRIRFAATRSAVRVPDTGQVYVDGEWLEHVRSVRADGEVTLEYTPPHGWSAGRHDVRVVYQDGEQKTRWYAWFFIVDNPRSG